MHALLTSFGLSTTPVPAEHRDNLFYRMPPTAFERRGQHLVPDYGLLLLCDYLIVDAESYDRLTRDRHASYDHVADLLRALHDEGFLRLEDYSARVQAARTQIDDRVNVGLSEDWSEPLGESLAVWRFFVAATADILDGYRASYQHTMLDASREERVAISAQMHALGTHLTYERYGTTSAEKELSAGMMRPSILRAYLEYVECNIELSRQLRAPIHDWSDYSPFYRRRIGRSNLQSPLDQRAVQVTRLFTVSLPELRPRRPTAIIKMLRDRRIESFRRLIEQAVNGEVTLDRDFAARTLLEVFRRDRRASRYRTVASYAFVPLSELPAVGPILGKAAEEVVGAIIENQTQQPFEWLFLLSELASSENAG